MIGLECCNENGILQIKNALQQLGINSQLTKKKNRTIWRLVICRKENIQRYHNLIGFLHPEKKQKLEKALASFMDYTWKIPLDKQGLFNFIKDKGKIRTSRNELKLLSIKQKNLTNLRKALKKYELNSKLLGPWTSNTGSQYYCLKIKLEDIHGRT